MSLVTTAALFNDDDNGGLTGISDTSTYIQQKRGHNRTQKRFPNQIIDNDKVNQVLKSITATIQNQPDGSDEDANLGDYSPFAPPPNPISQGAQRAMRERNGLESLPSKFEPMTNMKNSQLESSDVSSGAKEYDDDKFGVNDLQQNYGNSTTAHEYYKRFVPAFTNVPESSPSQLSYQNFPPNSQANSYGQQQQQTIGNHDVLLQKLNYMIHLLEEQQDEKTHSVTEEVILYSFLGIFIIFIVDSFSKVGKYTR